MSEARKHAAAQHDRSVAARYRHALATTQHRSRLLSLLWAIGWVKDARAATGRPAGEMACTTGEEADE